MSDAISIWWLIYPLMGLFAGFFAGLLGIGGGMILVSLLVMAFNAQGFPADRVMHLALGTSLATIIFTSLKSVQSHHQARRGPLGHRERHGRRSHRRHARWCGCRRRTPFERARGALHALRRVLGREHDARHQAEAHEPVAGARRTADRRGCGGRGVGAGRCGWRLPQHPADELLQRADAAVRRDILGLRTAHRGRPAPSASSSAAGTRITCPRCRRVTCTCLPSSGSWRVRS